MLLGSEGFSKPFESDTKEEKCEMGEPSECVPCGCQAG